MSDDEVQAELVVEGGQFAIIPAWVFASFSARAVVVYGVIAMHVGVERVAWPSRRRLAVLANASEDTVKRGLKELIDGGAVERVARFGKDGQQRSNLYVLRRTRVDGAGTPPRCESAPLPGAELHPLGGVNLHPITDHVEQTTGTESVGASSRSAPRPAKRSATIPVPDDFALTAADGAFAAERGVDAAVEFPRFMDYHRAKGTRYADWHATWRTWVRNQERWAREREERDPRGVWNGIGWER